MKHKQARGKEEDLDSSAKASLTAYIGFFMLRNELLMSNFVVSALSLLVSFVSISSLCERLFIVRFVSNLGKGLIDRFLENHMDSLSYLSFAPFEEDLFPRGHPFRLFGKLNILQSIVHFQLGHEILKVGWGVKCQVVPKFIA